MALIKTAAVSRFLIEAERKIAIIERCQPLNYPSELERLKIEWRRGQRCEPRFAYAPPPRLTELRQGLAAMQRWAAGGGWGAVLAARAEELEREAGMMEALGTPRFRELAKARYRGNDIALAREALKLAQDWAAAPPIAAGASRHLSDDATDPQSLLCEVRRWCAALDVPFRIEVRANMAAAAATGEGAILIAAERWLSALESRRIAVHEVKGHALPRTAGARDPSGVLLAGTAGAADDEEGHALLIEKREQVLHPGRRHSLALRHLAAEAMFDAASYCEVVQRLLDLDGAPDTVHALATRVFRGSGLGREWVYLPAMLRVEAKIKAEPSAESWFLRGRVSAGNIDMLASLGAVPETLELSS